MALTQMDIDDEALAEAMRLSGTKTKKDTVNLALREFVAGTAGSLRWSTMPGWRLGGTLRSGNTGALPTKTQRDQTIRDVPMTSGALLRHRRQEAWAERLGDDEWA